MLHNIYNYIYDFFKECFKDKPEKDNRKYTLNECLEILNKNFDLTVNDKK
tara:strand:- start:20 stop:169 length:150 start_codon:yes stop_codon:yes gene_type:complete